MADDRELLKVHTPVVDDSHKTIDPKTGMQNDYVILTAEERAKGFVKPVRYSYAHIKCNSSTWMANELAETYARNPSFYSGTFCAKCRAHFPLTQFVWEDGEPMEPSLQQKWNEECILIKAKWRVNRIAELKKELAELEANQ